MDIREKEKKYKHHPSAWKGRRAVRSSSSRADPFLPKKEELAVKKGAGPHDGTHCYRRKEGGQRKGRRVLVIGLRMSKIQSVGLLGGAGGNCTHAWGFCRPLPYYLATAPIEERAKSIRMADSAGPSIEIFSTARRAIAEGCDMGKNVQGGSSAHQDIFLLDISQKRVALSLIL